MVQFRIALVAIFSACFESKDEGFSSGQYFLVEDAKSGTAVCSCGEMANEQRVKRFKTSQTTFGNSKQDGYIFPRLPLPYYVQLATECKNKLGIGFYATLQDLDAIYNCWKPVWMAHVERCRKLYEGKARRSQNDDKLMAQRFQRAYSPKHGIEYEKNQFEGLCQDHCYVQSRIMERNEKERRSDPTEMMTTFSSLWGPRVSRITLDCALNASGFTWPDQ